jgi:hypothetical protein
MPSVNVQALLSIGLFLLALLLARSVNNINRGIWPGGSVWVLLRRHAGYVFTASFAFAFYAFANDILGRR